MWEYWSNARPIISEFNEYGGGPEVEEYEALDCLEEILELVREGNLSTSTKFDFLDDAFEEYDKENSGFEDALMEIFFEICDTKKEWEYLVEKLEKRPTDWRKRNIMEIQKKYLQNEDAYLKMRKENLHYGMDYWDLISFYIDCEEHEKAINTAEEGILKGDGRLSELLFFLFDHYAEKKDLKNIERVVNTALNKKTEQKAMLDRLHEYYKAQDNYLKAKEALIKAYEFTLYRNYYAEYVKIKEFLKDSDWKKIEPKIFKDIKEKNIHDYLRICQDKNMTEEIINTILDSHMNRFGYSEVRNFDKFADSLKKDFPKEIIDYYWQKAYVKIPNGNRKTYQIAAEYLEKVKHIYTKTLSDESAWELRFSDLKTEFKNRPAFLDEVKKL